MVDFELHLLIHNLIEKEVVVDWDMEIEEEHFVVADSMVEGHNLAEAGNHLVEVEGDSFVEEDYLDRGLHWEEHHIGQENFEEVPQDQEDTDQGLH